MFDLTKIEVEGKKKSSDKHTKLPSANSCERNLSLQIKTKRNIKTSSLLMSSRIIFFWQNTNWLSNNLFNLCFKLRS